MSTTVTTDAAASTDPAYIKLYTDVIYKVVAKRTDPAHIRKTIRQYHGQKGRIMNTGYSTKQRRYVGVMFDDGVMLWADTADLELHDNCCETIDLEPTEYPCRLCPTLITSCELCAECAVGNDPFFTSKYTGDHVR